MTQIPLGVGAYSRPYGKLPEIRMENRFFEQNPVGAERVSLLSRPGTKLFLDVGDGPIRLLFSQAGVFNEDLFIVSNQTLFRYDGSVVTPISGIVAGSQLPVMTSISIPGWEAVFITDGVSLQYYEGEVHATNQFDVTSIADNDQVRIDGVYYEFTTGSLNAGGPNGSAGQPWLIRIVAGSIGDTVRNLYNAINLLGVAGVDYSTELTKHPTVQAFDFVETTAGISFKVRALVGGVGGNSIVTTETGAGLSWVTGTLTGGGGHSLLPCSVPDNAPIIDLATLASHIICIKGASQQYFWIRPGEVDIDPLDFSSAESEPDYILHVVTVGDQFWLLGQSSSEAWYASGDADQPFLRTQGRAFSQGVIKGTLAKYQESVFVVGQDRIAYRIAGSPQRISHHGIEEKIRLWQESLS